MDSSIRFGFAVWVGLWIGGMAAGSAQEFSRNAPNPTAVQEVMSGARTMAVASWWGFNGEDVTETLQAAIDSGAKQLVVPYMGREWIVRPLKLRSDLELIFEAGVVVTAKKDAFKGTGDSLFSVSDASNITLRGYGATLRMRHQDYVSDAYEKGEWRMTLDFTGCTGVTVEGLRLESSGGDGVYLGATSKQPYCKDVILRDVVCFDHHRQGISVISAENLLIERCEMSKTNGTAPEAGIDFEPNGASERLVNCVVRNCVMADNDGAGILLYLKNLSKESLPISMVFENCLIRGKNDVGMGIGALRDEGPGGIIEFKHCVVDGPRGGGIYLYDKSPQAAPIRFEQCHWQNTWTGAEPDDRTNAPLYFHVRREELAKSIGGVSFEDCHVYDTRDRPVLLVEEATRPECVMAIKGSITLHGPYPAKIEMGAAGAPDLKIVSVSE